jgi:hypothetical protein
MLEHSGLLDMLHSFILLFLYCSLERRLLGLERKNNQIRWNDNSEKLLIILARAEESQRKKLLQDIITLNDERAFSLSLLKKYCGMIYIL